MHVGESPPQSASEEQGDEQLTTRLLPQIVVPLGAWKQAVQVAGQASAQATQSPVWQLGVSPNWQLPHCSVSPQPSGAGPHCTPASAQVFATQGSHCCPRQLSPAPQAWQGAPPWPHAPLAVPGWQRPSAAQQPLGHVCGVQGETHCCPLASQTNAPGQEPQLPPQPSGPQTLPAQSGWQQGPTQNGLPLAPQGPESPVLATQAAPPPHSASLLHPLGSRIVTDPPQMGRPVCET